ncbi:unnamed protein product [Mytilus coruscus]|uniref:Uncharacterized protein n=1 Tax=Mytilus coruscus TaxID=42192 RepID=A0A6J8DEM5_MYTCO|nr:unnamed protein product [Mytilus coruscus]
MLPPDHLTQSSTQPPTFNTMDKHTEAAKAQPSGIEKSKTSNPVKQTTFKTRDEQATIRPPTQPNKQPPKQKMNKLPLDHQPSRANNLYTRDEQATIRSQKTSKARDEQAIIRPPTQPNKLSKQEMNKLPLDHQPSQANYLYTRDEHATIRPQKTSKARDEQVTIRPPTQPNKKPEHKR